MKIILSPAKKMNAKPDILGYIALPEHIQQTEKIMHWFKTKSYEELKKLWCCNDKIAEQNFRRLEEMDLRNGLTPAIVKI